ncbi:hypothetical protein D3C81_1670980 [compost metagenome]
MLAFERVQVQVQVDAADGLRAAVAPAQLLLAVYRVLDGIERRFDLVVDHAVRQGRLRARARTAPGVAGAGRGDGRRMRRSEGDAVGRWRQGQGRAGGLALIRLGEQVGLQGQAGQQQGGDGQGFELARDEGNAAARCATTFHA